MSIDTTFKPIGETIVVDNTAALGVKNAATRGITTFRLVARVANAYVAWGPNPAAPTAPAGVGTVAIPAGAVGVLGLTVGVACYIEVPASSQFIGSAVFATSNIEITGGIGGVGG